MRSRALVLLCLAACGGAFASGQPDPGFGDGGLVVVHADVEQPFGIENASDMLVDSAGRAVSAGFAFVGLSQPNFALGLVTRHLPDGTPDASFDGDGVLHLQWQGKGINLFHVREQSDGTLLVGGTLAEFDGNFPQMVDAVVCRLHADGAIDTGFGTDGCRRLGSVSGGPGLLPYGLADMQVLPDDRIVVLGAPVNADPQQPRDFALVRLLPDGADDSSFGDASVCPDPAPRCGIALSPLELGDAIEGEALAVDTQGRIVVGADMNLGTFQLLTVLRYTAEGDFDLVFESLNFDALTGDPGTYHYAEQVHVTPEGALLVSGNVFFGNTYRVAVARWLPDGASDDSFGVGGRVVHVFDGQQAFNVSPGSFLQSDGKLLVAGHSLLPPWRCHVLRIDDATGALDTAFGTGGVATLDAINALAVNDCYTSAVVSDGRRVLVAGEAHLGPDNGRIDPFLLRLDQDDLFRDGFDD